MRLWVDSGPSLREPNRAIPTAFKGDESSAEKWALDTLILITLILSSLACGVCTLTLADREKRLPSPVYLIELAGRWWSVPADRADPMIACALIGTIGFLGSITLLLI